MAGPLTHLCHARGCNVPVPPKMLMCKRHWFMVPYALRKEVWDAYRPGQEVDKNPTIYYLKVATAAINAVAEAEAIAEKEETLRWLGL